MKTKTIKTPVTFGGIGLHSGQITSIKLLPRKSAGIIFVNEKKEKLRALFSNVTETQLGTTISNGNIIVKTIEHIMAAISFCNIDNLTIEISGEEIPILDGSAELFIKQLKKAGIVNLKDNRKFLKILKPVEYFENDKYVKLLPDDNFSIDMTINFPYGSIGEQRLLWSGQRDTLSARTFCHLKEIEYLWSKGLSRGGTLENVMVFDDSHLLDVKNTDFKMGSKEVTEKLRNIMEDFVRKYGENAYGFRIEKEAVHHKVLDCVGDMLTCGYYIKGKVVANKTGHDMNNKLLRRVFEDKNNYIIE